MAQKGEMLGSQLNHGGIRIVRGHGAPLSAPAVPPECWHGTLASGNAQEKQTTSGDDNKMDDSSADVDVEREDLRSHSIASLRLKAKEHLQQQVHEVALIIMKKETEDDSKECEKDSVSFPASPRFCGRGDVTEGSTRPASASLPSPFRSGSPAACEQGVCERD